MTTAGRAGSPTRGRVVTRPAGGTPLLTSAELAAELRKTPSTLSDWRYRGIGPAYLPGRPVTYRREDVDAWIASQRVTPAES